MEEISGKPLRYRFHLARNGKKLEVRLRSAAEYGILGGPFHVSSDLILVPVFLEAFFVFRRVLGDRPVISR